MSPYSYLIGYKTLITIFKVLQPLNCDLREVIADIIFDKLIMEDLFHDYETVVSLKDDNWEYDMDFASKFPDEITDKTMLQRFLGSLNYISPFYKNLSKDLATFTDRLKKGKMLPWNNDLTNLVKSIKKRVQYLPCLSLANPN